MNLMRRSTLEDTSEHQPQPSDTVGDAMSPKTHNVSEATFCTDLDQNIRSDRRAPNKEIPEFTAIQLARFWSQVQIGLSAECWPWTGAKAPAAYSDEIFYGTYRGFKVHRLAYTFLVGKIPERLTIDHVKARGCTNTLCCNPAHLEPISQTEQVRRRDGEKAITGVTLCKWGHVRPVGRKAKCVECNRMHARKFREAHPDRVKEYPSRQPKGYRGFKTEA